MSLFICQHNTVTFGVSLSSLSLPPPPSPLSLPESPLVWPTEGNSYSLVIMGRMMCALKCALPAWLPLRGPVGAKEEDHREGPRMERGQRDDGRAVSGRWMDRGSNYKGEIWPDKQYCAPQMSIRRNRCSSDLKWGWRRERGGEKEMRQMERCGDCDMRSVAQVASHTLCTHSAVTRQEKKKEYAIKL